MAVLTGQKASGRRIGWMAGLRATALIVLGTAAGLALIGVGAQAAFDGRAVPGLRVAGIDVGGLAPAELRPRLAELAARPWSAASVRVKADGRAWVRTNGDLGIAPDLDAATAAALAYGRTGDPFARVRAWLGAFGGTADLPFTLRAADARAERFVAEIAADVDRAAIDGEITLALTGASIREPVLGRELDRAHALSALLGAQTLGDRDVELRVRLRHPAVDDAGIASAASLVRAVTTPLDVSAGDRGVSEDPVGLASLLTVERIAAKPGELPAIPGEQVAPATRYRYVATLEPARVRAWAEAVATALDRPAKNATYTVAANGSLVVVPSEDGVKIDREAFVAQALSGLAAPVSGRRTVAPVFVRDVPVFTTADAAKHAAGMTRVSVFETFFPPNLARWRNISTGAAQFNDVVIAPGETFSFWKLLGPVTVERGYAYAGAIIDGRSDPNVIGGGLCQVSTTVFMAVAQAGFEIVERGSHDYYIDRYPLGLDAAVFDPGLDLKWRNDTPYPVLLRSSSSNIAVEFEVFTIPNGRTVQFGPAVETNFRDVRPDQPADSAFLPGAKVLGRDVTRTRTVYENGRIVRQDVFRSRYNPVWGGPAR